MPKFDNLSTIKPTNCIIESFRLKIVPWEHTKWLLILKPHPLDKVYIYGKYVLQVTKSFLNEIKCMQGWKP